MTVKVTETGSLIAPDPDPEDAVNFTVYVPGGVASGFVLLPPPDPQPATPPMTIPQINTASHREAVRRRDGSPNSSRQARLVAPPESHHRVRGVIAGRANPAVVAPVVVTVKVLVTAAVPVGVTLAGEKLQLTPVGRPEPHENVTAWLNPPAGVTVKTAVPEPPCATVIEAGAAVTVKLGGIGAVTVTVTAGLVTAA